MQLSFGRNTRELKQLHQRVRELEGQLIDITSGLSVSTVSSGGNTYTSLSEAIKEIKSKYLNQSTWGCPLVQRIINVRRSMVMPYGVDTTPVSGVEETASDYLAAKDVINLFLDTNDVNEGFAIDLAKEGELEGNVLLDLSKWDDTKKTLIPTYRAYSDYGYKISVSTEYPGMIKNASWIKDSKSTTLPAEDLAFIYFNGLTNSFVGVPTLAPVLNTCESLHQSLVHWHRFNSLFGKVTPVFECLTEEQADKINEQLLSHGWTLGTAIALAGKFTFAAPNTIGVFESLKGEMTFSLQIISGHTGVGPHFLGFPNLMSNRSCYSEDTETLTEYGWRHWWEIEDGTKIACYDPKTDKLVFEVPKGLHVYDVDEELCFFKNRTVDIAVTPDHDMWTRHDQEGPGAEWHKAKAETFTAGTNRLFLKAAPFNGEAVNSIEVPPHDSAYPLRDGQPTVFNGDDFAEFTGYYISEGGSGTYKTTGERKKQYHKIIHIGQNVGCVADKMRACFTRMGLRFNEHTGTDDPQTRYHIHHAGLSDWLSQNCGAKAGEKKLPRKYLNASSKQMRILFDALMAGDGSWDSREDRNSGYYSTTSEQLADDFQELASKLGFSTKKLLHYKADGNRSACWRVCLNARRECAIAGKDVTKLPYKGRVYCFSTPTGLFLTRRNGCVTIQGNTADAMGEPVEVVAVADITLWKNFWESVFDKVISKHNEKMAKKVEPGIIKPRLLPMTDRQWERATKFWLPAAEKGLVSLDLFLKSIPGVDTAEELKKQNKEVVNRWLGTEPEEIPTEEEPSREQE